MRILIHWLKERWLRFINQSVMFNQTEYNDFCDKILNQCLDDLDIVKQTQYRVSLRFKRTGEVYEFWTENFPYSYGDLLSKTNDYGTKPAYGSCGVNYTTRYRLRNAIKYNPFTD